MEFADYPRRRRPVYVVVALSAVVALVCAILSVARVGVLPPKVEPRELEVAGAATRIVVDAADSWAFDRRATSLDFESLTKRADLLGRLMTGAPVRARIGRRIGASADDIAAVAEITANVPDTLKEPTSEERASDILAAGRRYQLEIQSHPTVPTLDIYAQAPSVHEAERLANASVGGLLEYLRALARGQGVDFDERLRLEQLGLARGAVINPGAPLQIAGLTFLVAFVLSCCVLGLVARARRDWAGAVEAEEQLLPEHEPPPRAGSFWPRGGLALSPASALPGQVALPRPLPALDIAGALRLEKLRGAVTHGGDWPNTTRVLPWMLALFMSILWLVPFNSIALSASLPFDLKLDRIVLPFIALAWVLSLASGGPGTPRLRVTWIHVAVGVFVALACLSIVLEAGNLNRTLELDQSIKKLTLVIAYLSLFLMVASVVRRSEVRPFLNYFLVLAVIFALGIIWEYRFHYNVFYDWSDKLLPGIFQVGQFDSSAIDAIGRRETRGSAELGLEAVSMLAMALPIALAGILHATRTRTRVLYGLAACVILAGAMSTYRKSAFLAPIAVLLTFAYYRPRHLLKLAPLAAVALVAIHFLSPGALGSIAFQLDRNQLGVATVSDRTADYDAIRPDLLAHVTLGRGFGSYEQTSYRILDSEILHRIVEMGVLGLAAYLLMFVTVIAVARPAIRARHPLLTPPALAGAAAAVAFLAVSTLYDVMSFPHTPYIFLCLAAFVAITAKRPEEDKEEVAT